VSIYEDIYTKLGKIFTMAKTIGVLFNPNKTLDTLLYASYGLDNNKYIQSLPISIGNIRIILIENNYDGYLKDCGLFEYSKLLPTTLVIFVDNILEGNLFMNLYNTIKAILFINDGIDYLNSPLSNTIEGKTNTVAPILLAANLLKYNCMDFEYEKIEQDVLEIKNSLPKEYANLDELIKLSFEANVAIILESGIACAYIK